MDSVECAIALGADVVEMDIRKAPDRVLRVSHNCVSSEEYAGKPQLKEVFRLICDKGLALNCDIKESHALYDVLDLAEAFAFGPDRLFLSGSVSPEQLARDASITQRAGVYLNIEEILKFLSVGHLFQDHTESRFPELMNTPWNFVRGVPLEGEVLTSVITLLKTLGVRGLNLPHGMIIVAALSGVSESLVESARDVGAGKLRVFFQIILPLSYKDVMARISQFDIVCRES